MPDPNQTITSTDTITENVDQSVRDEVAEQVLTSSVTDGSVPKRDPFAPPAGWPGNRGLLLGTDGPIPRQYRQTIEVAILTAYGLDSNPSFREAFRSTISELTNKNLDASIYYNTLEKMIINYAETSKNSKIQADILAETQSLQDDPLFELSPAFSEVNGTNVWLREFQLQKGERAVVGSLIHEAAHLAGAPGGMLAEVAIDIIHNSAGYPR